MNLTATLLWLGSQGATPDPGVAEATTSPELATQAPQPVLERAPPRGTGMLVGGGLVLGMVVVPTLLLTVFDSVAAAECADTDGECWGGFMLQFSVPVMVAGLAIGTPLLAAGVQRNKAWRRQRSDQRVALRPRFNPSRSGLTVGFELRF